MWQFNLADLFLLASASVPDFNGIISTVIVWVNAALGILVILEVLFATIKAIWIWWSVIRNSDEPDTRAVYLSSLKWPIIAIIGTCVVIALANVVIQIVKSAGLNINV
ncbi:MAG: Mbov_0395 family pilin-like conjugal transfer protein [Spiroplasma sp.]